MPYELMLPPIGSQAGEGIVVAWFKREGATVRAGEPVVEVQFDKVSTEVESPIDGHILRILAPRDAVIRPGQTIAVLLTTDEASSAATGADTAPPAATATAAAAGGFPASPAARRLAKELAVDLAAVTPANGARITEDDVRHTAQTTTLAVSTAKPPAASEVRATPIAKRMAREHGIDLSALTGTGPGGRIGEQDVQAAIQLQRATAVVTRQPLSPMRRAIARRMMESLGSTAQLTMTMQADVTALVEAREHHKATLNVTYTDLIVRSAALTLRQHPAINVRWTTDGIEHLTGIHIGMAVALDDGLVVPVVRDADKRSLAELNAEIKRLSELARSNRLTEQEMAGGVMTVTNLGMYGVDAFTPILNPPEAAILGVGRIYEQLARSEQGIIWRQMMTLSLTIDHQLIDGAPAAAWLRSICQLLGDPGTLMSNASP